MTTRRLQGQRGASLVIALAMLLVLGVVLSAVLAYTNTSVRASETYRRQRVDRYAGDGAIEAAINYVRRQPLLGRDPSYQATDPPCVYNVPTDAGVVAVTCLADEGEGSGVPAETGLVPNQAILATGQRHNEVGPLNQTQCDTIFGIGQNAIREPSILFRPGEVRGYFEEGSLIPCANRNRTIGQFQVRGKIIAAGRAEGNGSLSLLPTLVNGTSTPSQLKALYGCSISVSPPGCPAPTAAEYADPAIANPVAWAHVPIDWTQRTSGYRVDPNNLTGRVSDLTPTSSCGLRDTIILLPGFYPNANTINQFTSNTACKESTIWLAPDPGPDGILLTDDDKTGAYYFGFTNTSASWPCSDLSANPHRLCIGGGSADSSPRVVAGTPVGWNPLAIPGSVTPRTVQVNRAQTVDSGLSQSWFNAAGAQQIGDGNVADYRATVCIFGVCFSSNRSIRLRNFAPQVAQGPDASNNKIRVEVSHRSTGSGLNPPRVTLRAVSAESGTKVCSGSYGLPSNSSGTLRVDALRYPYRANGAYTAADIAAADDAVAACLNSADLINGLQITLEWTGNPFNTDSPRVYLDGARFSFQSTPGASFPIAAPGGSAAVIDCDKEKAGAQLIFGGDSHAYVPDGSLEVCAGPYPTSPGDHQQIAVYGIKAIEPLRPTSVTASNATFQNAASAAQRIAEPAGRQVLNIRYSTGDTCGFCTINFEGRAVMAMQGYSPPTGLAVQRVDARVTYDSNNACLLGICIGTESQLRVGSCSINAPRTQDLRHWETNLLGGGRSCITPAQVASGVSVTWAARAQRICAFWICGAGAYTDQLDGVELLVATERTAGGTVPVPQHGCIVDYPNYWEGVGSGDCAIVKADSLRPNNIFTNEADWIGRVSLQGTVYAPSAAFEIDELDSAYALASRGLVVRHLRVKGLRARPGFTQPIIDTQLDTTPAAREAVFVACKRAPGRESSTAPCSRSDGDSLLTRARVRFEYNPNEPGVWTPDVVWWTDQR